MTLKVVVYAQELKSLAKRSRQAQDNSKPQRSGDSDSDLDSSEGSDDEVKLERIQQIFVFLIYHPAICVSTPIDLQKALQSTLGLLPASQTLYFCSKLQASHGMEVYLAVQVLPCYSLAKFAGVNLVPFKSKLWEY